MPKTAASIVVVFFIMLTSMTGVAQEGSSSTDVGIIQCLLVRLGYDPGPVDGVYGDRTIEAIRTFHETRNLDLAPGEIEPQTATVLENLMTAFVSELMNPPAATASLYQAAIAGDGDAASELGSLYLQGGSVPADPMMAYLWWTVAESTGSSRVLNLKDWLKTSDKISDHEIAGARRLVVELSDTVRNR